MKEQCCCQDCKFFEERTRFCRKNPPMSVIMVDHGKSFMSSSFPKIQMPQIDFCFSFEKEGK